MRVLTALLSTSLVFVLHDDCDDSPTGLKSDALVAVVAVFGPATSVLLKCFVMTSYDAKGSNTLP